jgi:hypothetical protein
MAATILYAREYPFDSPIHLLKGKTLLLAQTPSDAITTIEHKKDSIDGYVLGMVMVRDGIRVEQVDEICSQYREAASQAEKMKTGDPAAFGKVIFKRSCLFEELNGLLDYNGGAKVFQHLKQKGYVGKKPIVWFTSQYGVNDVVRKDAGNSIEVAYMHVNAEAVLSEICGKL